MDLLDSHQGPRGKGTQKIVPLHVPFMKVTHTANLVDFLKKNWPPQPPWYPEIPPLEHYPSDRIKIPSDMFLYLSFVSKHTKFGLKIFEIDSAIEI